jgi:hypothetical protein
MKTLREYIFNAFDNAEEAHDCIVWAEDFGAPLDAKYDAPCGTGRANDILNEYYNSEKFQPEKKRTIPDCETKHKCLTVGEVHAYLTRILKDNPDVANFNFYHAEFGSITDSACIEHIESGNGLIIS